MKFITKIIALIKKIMDDKIDKAAALVAYYSLLAFFPFMIFLLTVISYSSINPQEILSSLAKVLPSSATELVSSVVIDTYSNSSQNLLSFGIIFALFSGSGGVSAIISGLNTAYNIKENRNFVLLFFMAIFYTVVLALAVVVCSSLVVFGEVLGNGLVRFLNLDYSFKAFWNFYRILLPLVLIFVMFILIYKVFPAKKLQTRRVIPGAAFTTIGWYITSVLFAFYVNNFGNYSKVYGSIGAVIVLMTWIYITSFIILIGGEINAHFGDIK